MQTKHFSNNNKLVRLVLTALFILAISFSIPAYNAQAQTPTAGPIVPDAFPLPGPIVTLKDQAAAAATSNAPGYYDTSAYMIGKVVVGIIMPQCTNATPGVCTQTWTTAQQNTVVSKIQTGINFWQTSGGTPANLNFQYDVQASIPTSYEPINQPVSTECSWVSDVLARMGYAAASSCAANAYAHFDQVYAYVNYIRTQYQTDWAYAMIVANSPDSAAGSTFAGGQYFAYAYLGGPFLIMTYGNGGWLSSNMDRVAAHETGHIFGAADEYYQAGYGGCTSTTQRYGYLGVPNGNCQNPTPTGVPSVMIDNTYALDTYAAGQIGWRDSNSNGKPDPIDTIPTVTLSPHTPNPTSETTLTYNGSAQLPPYPKAMCGADDQCYAGGSVTTQTIANVQHQVDASPWMNATASDGAFNTDFENFNFSTVYLPGGVHTIGVHSQASQGNPSTTWSDSVTVNAPAAAASPSNDDFDTPKVISSIPYSDLNLDTTGATTAPDDPSIPNCASDPGFASVWYSYTPSVNQDLYLDTFGSDYDTLLAVWTGTRGSLVPVACNDTPPDGITNQAALPLSVTAGTTYYFEIIQYTRPPAPQAQAGGGILDLHVTSFQDVPGDYWAWRWIEGLYSAGITVGCNISPRLYCPGNPVTRAQMAIFLERGMNGSSYTPPPATGTVFNDVSINYWAAAWIEKLAADGITAGCGNGNYCPDSPVTRAQMAIFLERSMNGSSYAPPPATGTVFNDVPSNYWAAAWIEKLAADGITAGCGNGNYCPDSPVTRDQMAVFLDRTFGLPPLP